MQNRLVLKIFLKVKVPEVMMMMNGMALANLWNIPIQSLMMERMRQKFHNQLQVRTFRHGTCSIVANDILGGAYVPPHLRNAQRQDDSNSEVILKLTRQLKGLLNR